MYRDPKHYYEILQLGWTASDEDIRLAFRRRAKELHPDSDTGDAAAFILLKRAYDVLSAPRKRASYDRLSRPRRREAARALPPLPDFQRPRRFRIGGMSLARFAAAFIFMAGLSIGAVEVILDSSGAPVGSIFRGPERVPTTAKAAPVRLEDDAPAADPALPHPDR